MNVLEDIRKEFARDLALHYISIVRVVDSKISECIIDGMLETSYLEKIFNSLGYKLQGPYTHCENLYITDWVKYDKNGKVIDVVGCECITNEWKTKILRINDLSEFNDEEEN